mmetsp:Transcript_30530/g.34964  ORF Transcript_30530/g.34964 Transcript_30530/m.34964 type:complete len:109 (-) Transcript_30530:304-630(-)
MEREVQYTSRMFFPKNPRENEEEQKNSNNEDDKSDDLYEEDSYSPRRVDLYNFLRSNRQGISIPTMINGREIREIMYQYNGSIDSFRREIMDLKSRCRTLDNEILKQK